MDGKSSIDLEQDSDSSSGSDWMSEMEKSKGRQGGKRKIREQDDKEKETYSNKKISARSKSNTGLIKVFQEARNKIKLTVRCGKMTGLIYKKKYENGEKCVLCKGHWFTPRQFEKFGGKGNNKKWKSSIYYKSSNGLQQVQLEKLIQNRCLPQYGYLRKSSRQTDVCGAYSSPQQSVTRRKTLNHTKYFTGSKESNRRNNNEMPACGNEEDTVRKRTIQLDSSSDESISVAERVKLNRREPVNSIETVGKKITEHIGSTSNNRDSPAPPTEAPGPAVSSVVEEPDQTTDEEAAPQMNFSGSPVDAPEPAVSSDVEEPDQTTDEEAAPQMNFSGSPAEWQKPVTSEGTEKTDQTQLFEFLANQFNTINNTLKSIDLSLKKLVEKESQNTLPQYISLTPAVIENLQIQSSVKEEQITQVLNQ
ncbi:deformed epidermal autoregulatory factor 1 homolog [Puntigrus tetrazona]|uniref:deformed epidermal autoregulatory factor 1 homolog n=1 Tax=Puntigrus tetrazona TaxID=1606681 RepID=UPI001C89288C|nr:deformed epidermal autoregulatory factor 1 homolog [Puntigrus tetrazona]